MLCLSPNVGWDSPQLSPEKFILDVQDFFFLHLDFIANVSSLFLKMQNLLSSLLICTGETKSDPSPNLWADRKTAIELKPSNIALMKTLQHMSA